MMFLWNHFYLIILVVGAFIEEKLEQGGPVKIGVARFAFLMASVTASTSTMETLIYFKSERLIQIDSSTAIKQKLSVYNLVHVGSLQLIIISINSILNWQYGYIKECHDMAWCLFLKSLTLSKYRLRAHLNDSPLWMKVELKWTIPMWDFIVSCFPVKCWWFPLSIGCNFVVQ